MKAQWLQTSLSQEKLEQAVSGNTGKRNKSTSKPVKDWENKDSIIVAERIAKMYGDTLESMVQSGGNGYAYEDIDGITIQACYDEDKDRFKRDIFFNEKVEGKSFNKQGSTIPTFETVELSRHLSMAAVVSKHPPMPIAAWLMDTGCGHDLV